MPKFIKFKLNKSEYRAFLDFAYTVGAVNLNTLAKQCIAYTMNDARRKVEQHEEVNNDSVGDATSGSEHNTEAGNNSGDVAAERPGQDADGATFPNENLGGSETD